MDLGIRERSRLPKWAGMLPMDLGSQIAPAKKKESA